MKNLWIPLVAVIVLAAASTASADWTYTTATGWTYVDTVYPAPTVYYQAPAPSVYVYRPPVVVAPSLIAPLPVITRAPIVVRSRVVAPRRFYRRTVWRVW